MPHTKVECYDRTRLFYLVCLCDHHCSLKYGRPPMTQDWRSLKPPTTFLRSDFSNSRDFSLISQLELWNTTRAVFEQFGADVESSAATEKLEEVDKLGHAYHEWHHTSRGILGTDGLTGSLPELYYDCGLLYLYSHIHRGGSMNQTVHTSAKLVEFHNHFRGSAHAVIRIIIDGQLRLLDLPSYFGTMLAFATVSLIKIIREDKVGRENVQETLRLLRRLAEFLRDVKLPQYSSHLYAGISKGLDQATESLQAGTGQFLETSDAIIFDENIFMDDIWNMDFTDFGSNWMGFDEH